jgi:hypothetical protein
MFIRHIEQHFSVENSKAGVWRWTSDPFVFPTSVRGIEDRRGATHLLNSHVSQNRRDVGHPMQESKRGRASKIRDLGKREALRTEN